MTNVGWTHRGVPLRASLLASILLALLGIGAGSAAAHDGEGHQPALAAGAVDPVEAAEAVLGADAEPAGEGLIEISPDKGKPVLTHGPDLRAYKGGQPGFRPGDPERAPVCATDYYQRVIYAHPGLLPANAGTQIAEIRSIIRRMNFVLNADSLASGGISADFKVLCDGAGRIRVDTLTLPALEFSAIIDAVRNVPALLDNRADYTVFVDAPDTGWCGIATYVADERPGVENYNNEGGGYAAIERGCWDTSAPLHEVGHTQGAVQYNSPSSTGVGAHCNEDYDVMCYSPDGGDLRQSGTVKRCTDRIRFDCGYDDYFNTAPKPGTYLAQRWNLGSPANRFIRFSAPTGENQPPATGVPGVDDEAPLLVILQKPGKLLRAKSRTRRVKFRFDAFEQTASYRCRINRKPWQACSSPVKLKLRHGRHVFRVRAYDEAGNTSKVKRIGFRVARAKRR